MISTGLQKLDEFLGGGIPAGVIVDIFGGNGTGKTQLLLQLSINSINDGGSVLYLDTTGGFRPERILEIQNKSNLEFDILEKILKGLPPEFQSFSPEEMRKYFIENKD